MTLNCFHKLLKFTIIIEIFYDISWITIIYIFRYIFKVELSQFGEIEFNEDECKELLTDLLVFANNVSQVSIKSHKMLFMNWFINLL